MMVTLDLECRLCVRMRVYAETRRLHLFQWNYSWQLNFSCLVPVHAFRVRGCSTILFIFPGERCSGFGVNKL